MNLAGRIAGRLARDAAALQRGAGNFLVRRFILPGYEPLLRAASGKPGSGVMALRYRYFGGKAGPVPSDGEDNLTRCLAAAGVTLAAPYNYDEDFTPGLRGDETLVRRVAASPPSLLLLSSYDCFSSRQPRFDVIRAIRARLEIPVVAVWWDSTSETARRQFEAMYDAVDLNVLIESSALAAYAPDPARVLRLWAPIDPSLFRPADGGRDIPVSFLGSTAGYRALRLEYLEHVKRAGIELLHTGGPVESPVSIEEYARLLGRARISLNFSHSVENTHQLKGRVIEIMFSGALLMENRNPEIERYFKPMSEYVEFTSREDLAGKIRYFLEHEEERAAIAAAGRRRALELFGGSRFCDQLEGALAARHMRLPRGAGA